MTTQHHDDSLVVTFIDSPIRLEIGESLRFGRQGDLVIDANPFLHRVVGRFSFREGFWWLQNHGSRTELTLVDSSHGTRTSVRPGQQVPIVARESTVAFSAGPTSYELEVHRDGDEFTTDESGVPVGTATIDFGVVPLSDEQHLLLVALCEPRLAGATTLPTNQALAERIGWTITKLNRKLDSVCTKLSRQGVRGLRGSADSLATDRRAVLVEHAISARLVTADDLGLLSVDRSVGGGSGVL